VSTDSDALEAQLEMPDCQQCEHYYITHDASFPYGCRSMNFKSKRLPMLDVMEASNAWCLRFQPRVMESPAN
jgi:hypothetical protein